jgi:hypothetical protein
VVSIKKTTDITIIYTSIKVKSIAFGSLYIQFRLIIVMMKMELKCDIDHSCYNNCIYVCVTIQFLLTTKWLIEHEVMKPNY